MSKEKTTINVNNYGEMLGLVNGMELLEYYTIGSYQGSYIAIFSDDHRIFFYEDSFGSCSGCDWLEDQAIGTDGKKAYTITYKSAVDYCGELKPKYIIPVDDKDLLKSVLRLTKLFIEGYA